MMLKQRMESVYMYITDINIMYPQNITWFVCGYSISIVVMGSIKKPEI